MAVKPKSYKKNGYTYTESSPGSNKFQNFTAAKPTVKEVRVASNANKTKAATKSATQGFPKGTADRQPSISGVAFSKGLADRQSTTPKPYARMPSATERAVGEKGKRGVGKRMPVEAPAPRANRQGGMDTGNVMKLRPPANSSVRIPSATELAQGDKGRRGIVKKKVEASTAPAKKSIVGSIIDRVTQPPKKLAPSSVKMLNEARAEITPILNMALYSRGIYRLGKTVIQEKLKKTFPKKADGVGRPVEELLKRGRGTPKAQPAYARPFPKGKGTYKGKRTPGTYTAN